MRRTYLGEFEEIVLIMVAILDGEAYGVTIRQEIEQAMGRLVTFGTVHNTLLAKCTVGAAAVCVAAQAGRKVFQTLQL